jgi:hypothetical protein
VKRQRRLRKLAADAELIRRRAAGEPLRALAIDYGVTHTTLGRFFARPQVVQQLRQASRLLRAEPEAKQRPLRLRRLAADGELIRRRAAGEPLRALAVDYGVAHTTLARFFARPEVVTELRQAARQLHAERQAEAADRRAAQRCKQELKREVLRKVKEQAAFERANPHHPAAVAHAAGRQTKRSDDDAAAVVASGGGLQEVIETTGLRTLKNVRRLINPTILKQALENDARAEAAGPA